MARASALNQYGSGPAKQRYIREHLIQTVQSKTDQRRHYRRLRNALSPHEQRDRAASLLTNFSRTLLLLRYQRFALYATGGELKMHFAPVSQESVLRHGYYDLLEPAAPTLPGKTSIDVILMPLVAFDSNGTRLGMGGGFYDRDAPAAQLRVGLAHELQQAEQNQALPSDSWDKPLDAVITERRILSFNSRATSLLFNGQQVK